MVQIGQNGNSNVAAQTSTGTDASQETERLKKQLEERKKSIETRLTNSNKTISSTEDEINQLESKTFVGIFARMSGQKGVLEEQLKAEKRFRGKLEIERVDFNKTSERVEKLLQEGKVEEAKAVLTGREAEYKEKIKSATSRLSVDYKQTKEDLKDVDKFLANREQDIEKAHTRLVILASLISFGKGKAIITAAKATAFGLTVGLSSNTAEGLSNTFQYGQSGKESTKTAALKTGKDAWTSFKVGAAGGFGKFLGGLKSLSALSNITKAFISGSAVSAATNITDTTVGAVTGEDKRTLTQKGVDFVKDAVIGGLSSMLGLRGEQWQQGKSAVKSAIIRGTTDVAAPTALNITVGNVTNITTGREMQTADQILDSTLDTTTSTLVGAYSNTKSSSNKAEPNNPQTTTAKPQSENTEHGSPNTSQPEKQALPPPKPSTKETPKPIGEGEVSSTPQPKQNAAEAAKPPEILVVPGEIKNSQAFKSAENKGKVSVEVDENLPPGVNARAEVVEEGSVRSTKIKVSKEVAENIKTGNLRAIKILSEEIDHANQKMIDPIIKNPDGSIVKNPDGSTKTMSFAEYKARRAFQEVTAKFSSKNKVEGKKATKVAADKIQRLMAEGKYDEAATLAKAGGNLAEMKRLIDAGNFEEAIKLANLTDEDMANYQKNYKDNVNPNREKLIQTSNSAAARQPKLDKTESRKFLDEAQDKFGDASAEELKDVIEMGILEAEDKGLYSEYDERIRESISWRDSPEERKMVLEVLDAYKKSKAVQEVRDHVRDTFGVLEGNGKPGTVFLGKITTDGDEKTITGKTSRIDKPHIEDEPVSKTISPKIVSPLEQAKITEAQNQLLDKAIVYFKDDLCDTSDSPAASVMAIQKRIQTLPGQFKNIKKEVISRRMREALYEVASDTNSTFEAVEKGRQLAKLNSTEKMNFEGVYKRCIEERFHREIQRDGKLSETSIRLIDKLELNQEYKDHLPIPPAPIVKTINPVSVKSEIPDTKIKPPAPEQKTPSSQDDVKTTPAKKEVSAESGEIKPQEKAFDFTAADLERLGASPHEIAHDLPGSAGDERIGNLLNNLRVSAIAKQPFEVVSKISGFDSPEEAIIVLKGHLKSVGIDEDVANLLDNRANKNVTPLKPEDFQIAIYSFSDNKARLLFIEAEIIKIKNEPDVGVQDLRLEELDTISRQIGLDNEVGKLYLKHNIVGDKPHEGSKEKDSIQVPEDTIEKLRNAGGNINPGGRMLSIKSNIEGLVLETDADGNIVVKIEHDLLDYAIYQTQLNRLAELIHNGSAPQLLGGQQSTGRMIIVEPHTKIGDIHLVAIHPRTNSRYWGEYNEKTGEVKLLGVAERNDWENRIIPEYQKKARKK